MVQINKLYKDWLTHLKVDRGIDEHRQHGNLINLLFFFQNKECRLYSMLLINAIAYTHICRPTLVLSTSDFQFHNYSANISTHHYQAVISGILLRRYSRGLSKYLHKISTSALNWKLVLYYAAWVMNPNKFLNFMWVDNSWNSTRRYVFMGASVI
jgi:hypothetical protein